MSELREVFEMVTKQAEPDLDAWKQQEDRQRRTSRNRKFGAIAVAAMIAVAAVVVVIRAVDERREPQLGGRSNDTNTAPPVSMLPEANGPVEPGRYLLTLDPNVDASYRVSMDVPEGYEGGDGSWILRPGTSQTGLIVMAVGDVQGDACRWRGTRMAVSSTDEVVAALAGQQGIRSSASTDITLDGFAGSYMERTIPAGARLSECDELQFRTWVSTGGGPRYLGNPGQVDLLWILDVEGVPIVIDVALEASASAQDRAELLQIVESIQIDPR